MIFLGVRYLRISEYDLDIGQISDNVYVKTKFLAEKAIADEQRNGLQANIYRVGNIVTAYHNGIMQDNVSENAFYCCMQAFAKLGVVHQDYNVELSYVDFLAQAVGAFSATNYLGETFHLLNPYQENVGELTNKEMSSLKFKLVSWPELIEFLHKNQENPLYTEAIETILLHFNLL
jgi:thioester reductase-like protein